MLCGRPTEKQLSTVRLSALKSNRYQPRTYQTLASQVAERILTDLRAGKWIGPLPGERRLAEELQVSRKTLRKGLNQLQRLGVLATDRGVGHRVAERLPKGARLQPAKSVGLISPESLADLRPYTALWVDELRSLLFQNGFHVTLFSGRRFLDRSPENILERLVSRNPQSGWLLLHSTEPIQRWFHASGIPCVIAGSNHSGLTLPNVDWHYRASCRHAAGMMLRRGHRRIAFLTRRFPRAGDMESELGFIAGAKKSRQPGVTASILHHEDTVDDVEKQLLRAFGHRNAPTALLVANPVYYLTAMSFLARWRLRVPLDVSLVSRDDDVFLAYLSPKPTRYSFNPRIYARRLVHSIIAMVEGRPLGMPVQRILPKFLPGESLGDPPALAPQIKANGS